MSLLIFCEGETKGLGAYAEYTLADERLAFEVPQNISLDQAATMPLASLTAFLAFFSAECLNIDLKESAHKSILIWGGSCKPSQGTSVFSWC